MGDSATRPKYCLNWGRYDYAFFDVFVLCPVSPVGSGSSVIAASVVRSIVAALMAFSSATLITLMGSMIPASIILQYSPVAALKPWPGIIGSLSCRMYPALFAIVWYGYLIASCSMSAAIS